MDGSLLIRFRKHGAIFTESYSIFEDSAVTNTIDIT